MYTEVLTLNGTPFNIWYESLEDRQKAINQVQLLHTTTSQGCSTCGSKNSIYGLGYSKILSLQTNILQNSNFQTMCGFLPCNWWSGPPGSTATFPASVGSAGITSTSGGGNAYWGQQVPISPSSSYTLTGTFSTQGVSGVGAFLELDFFDASGAYISGSAVNSSPITGTTGSAQYSVSATAPSNAAKVNALLVLSGTGTVTFTSTSLSGGGGGGCVPPCPSGYICQGTTCVPSGGGCVPPCPTGYVCQGTTCVPSGGGGGGGGCTNCDLTNNYCVAGTCLPKKYVMYGGLAFGAVFLLSILK